MKLHHIGIVVQSIAESIELYEKLGFDRISDVTVDEIQKVRVLFVGIGDNSTTIELIEPIATDSPITNFLAKKGGGLHHICYEVDDIEARCSKMRSQGALIVCKPVPAAAFGSRRIAFAYMDKSLIEFVESAI